LLPGIPRLKQSRDAIYPTGHVDTPTGGDHYHRILVSAGHFLDQLVLARRQSKGPIRAFAFGLGIETDGDEHRVNFGSQFLCLFANELSLPHNP
jgi:hypothetical protein